MAYSTDENIVLTDQTGKRIVFKKAITTDHGAAAGTFQFNITELTVVNRAIVNVQCGEYDAYVASGDISGNAIKVTFRQSGAAAASGEPTSGEWVDIVAAGY